MLNTTHKHFQEIYVAVTIQTQTSTRGNENSKPAKIGESWADLHDKVANANIFLYRTRKEQAEQNIKNIAFSAFLVLAAMAGTALIVANPDTAAKIAATTGTSSNARPSGDTGIAATKKQALIKEMESLMAERHDLPVEETTRRAVHGQIYAEFLSPEFAALSKEAQDDRFLVYFSARPTTYDDYKKSLTSEPQNTHTRKATP